MTDVTVIIPVRNGRDYINHSIESVLRQSHKGIRLIVSDNGSSDGTIEIIERLRSIHDFDFFQQDGSLSMFEHFNLCIEYVGTPYYMLLCHDDLISDCDAIEDAMSVIKLHPKVAAIYSNMLYVDEYGKVITNRRFHQSGIFDGYHTGLASIFSMRNLYGIPLLVSKQALGLHRYQLDMPYVADIELSLYLSKQGLSYRINKYLIENRFHQSNSTKGLYIGALNQMQMLAAMYSIKLDFLKKSRMQFMAFVIAFAKYIFFQYLLFRRYFCTTRN